MFSKVTLARAVENNLGVGRKGSWVDFGSVLEEAVAVYQARGGGVLN